MTDTFWTDNKIARAHELYLQGWRYREIAEELNAKSANAVRSALYARGLNGAAVLEHASDAGPKDETVMEVDHRDTVVVTLDDAIRVHKIDLAKWEIVDPKLNSWPVGGSVDGKDCPRLYQVKLRLRPRRGGIDPKLLGQKLMTDLAKGSPKLPKLSRRLKKGHPMMLEVSLYDQHFGKHCWSRLSGQGWDLEKASEGFLEAVRHFVEQNRGRNIEQVLFPMGHDLIHVDNFEGTTSKGTKQDMGGLVEEAYVAAAKALITAIDYLRTELDCPVHIPYVRSNHDGLLGFTMAQVVDAYFSKCESVTVDAGPEYIKYHLYGEVLIAMTHGDGEKLESLAAEIPHAVPDLWAKSTIRECHMGHLHKVMTRIVTPGRPVHAPASGLLYEDSVKGIVFRTDPSLTPPDRWHVRMGYTHGVRQSIARRWHPELGLLGTDVWDARTNLEA